MENTLVDGSTTNQKKKHNLDQLSLQSADNPNSIICSTILIGNNYFGWCKAIKLALLAKNKLGFLDGSCPKPTDPVDAKQWKIVDAMVRSWILNSISEELKDNFLEIFIGNYTTLNLWVEIKRICEGQRRYGIKKKMSSIKQGSLTLERYYSKFKMLLEELRGLKPLACSKKEQPSLDAIEVGQQVIIDDEEERLLEFLVGLNDSHAHVIDYILIMDPFPSIENAFKLLLINVEARREATIKLAPTASFSTSKTGGVEYIYSFKNARCADCNMIGHFEGGCFSITGYPEWWNQMDQNEKNKYFTNAAITPHDEESRPKLSFADFISKTSMKNMKGLKEHGGSSSNFNSGDFSH
ncbi:uncharacterized protein LOC124912892 [Impatiens glandulifera]|uniref:uncharacterized protein LOC124912892 n=1 Tax=Impatiens glandulifera TaxID=253017 RepID=UPI001FB10F65|nr:uncharacterized protein LOC124912892 [Impatiens glandulifera]